MVENCDERLSYMDYDAIYLGYFLYALGHCTTDNIGRTWVIKQMLEENKNIMFIYTSLHRGGTNPIYFQDILSRLGLPQDKIVKVEEPTYFKKLYVQMSASYQTQWIDLRHIKKEFLQLIQRLIDSSVPACA